MADDPERPIYPKDDQLETKIENWVQVFTALLIEKCNEMEGKVYDCDMVLEASRAYQEKEDFWAQFMKEKISKGNKDDRIKKTDIRAEFKEWYEANYGNKAPAAKELYEYLDKTLGKYRKRGLSSIRGEKLYFGEGLGVFCTNFGELFGREFMISIL